MKHTSETVQAWLGYLHVPELKALKELAASLPESSQVINLGAGAGTSGLALMESPNKLRVTTVGKQKEVSLHIDGLGAFRVPERTLHITGYPRSGNTWAITLFRQAVGDQFRVRKSHQRRDEFTPEPNDLVLHIRRDPRDVLISIMHYRGLPFDRAFARLQGADGIPYLPIELTWDGASTVNYEDLSHGPEVTLSAALGDLQISPSRSRTIADAVAWSSFDTTLQRFPERKGAMWQGKVGSWKRELTRRQAQQFDEVFGAYLRAEGYADEGWGGELP